MFHTWRRTSDHATKFLISFRNVTNRFTPAYEWVGNYTTDDHGNKKIGLIVHGLMGNGKSWVPTAQRLQNQMANSKIQCLVVDLRHHNLSAVF